MKTLILYLGILFSLYSCSSKTTKNIPKTEKKPNILYIFTDDQTIRSIQSYERSHNWVQTPNIDKLAQKGVQFNFSYTGAKCVPSRGNALTGQFQYHYDRQTEYWPTQFRKQGYYTGMIGKWHWSLPRHDKTWDWSAVWEHHLRENHTNYYYNQKLRINGKKLVDIGYSTDAYTDYTIKFLNERAKDKDQPWYFWLCYAGVHGPFTPAERHKDMYLNEQDVDIPTDVFGPRLNKPDYMRDMTMWDKDSIGNPIYKNRSLNSWVKQYNEAVKSIDDGLGAIIKTLEETNQLDNTIIIFTSDNGLAWGQHGFRIKVAPYDANQRTPLIISRPEDRKIAGRQCDYPVNGVDIIKTIHSLSGVTPKNKLDGRDITSIIDNPTNQKWGEDKPMIQTYTGNIYGNEEMVDRLKKAHATGNWKKFVVHKTGIRAWMMMRKNKYKYIRYIYPDYIEELYDLSNDSEELNNLAVNKDHHELLESMRKETVSLFKANNATFTDLLPKPKVVSR